MRSLIRALAIFFSLMIVSIILKEFFNAQFGVTNFFENRGVFFLVFIAITPRLTLLFSSVVTGGIIWWLGWLFYPRILVATLATVAYFETNPILVVISWFIALGGEFAEKWGLSRNKVFIHRSSFRTSKAPVTSHQELGGDAIEAEFIKKS